MKKKVVEHHSYIEPTQETIYGQTSLGVELLCHCGWTEDVGWTDLEYINGRYEAHLKEVEDQ